MKLAEAKDKFLQTWGALGSNWGVSRTMAQIHALLLIAPDPLSAEDVMEQLQISRGNANLNIRALIDWGLVQKELRSGERKEFFVAEKDIWKVFRMVVKERRKRELEPMLRILADLKEIDGNKTDRETKEFIEVIDNIHRLAGKADKSLATLIKADENWFLGSVMKLMR
ncbi:MAG: GbsR/MarR family transcriptional regulator [Bacteroidia bacterium]